MAGNKLGSRVIFLKYPLSIYGMELFRRVSGLVFLFKSLRDNPFVDQSPTLTFKNNAIPFGTLREYPCSLTITFLRKIMFIIRYFQERSSSISHFVQPPFCPSVRPSLTVRFFLHISYITRLDKFSEVPRQNIMWVIRYWKGGGAVTFLALATQNILYGHMIWRGLICFKGYYRGIDNTQTRHRQYKDKTLTRHRNDMDKTQT